MKIGIIGAGQIGGTLTRRFAALRHDVSVANSRGPVTLASLARETGPRSWLGIAKPSFSHQGAQDSLSWALNQTSPCPVSTFCFAPSDL
jgi:predicted dinucleotide-binding enzyme